jgi:outer membrane protein TolC
VRERADALRRLILPSADAASWETTLVPSTPLPVDTSASSAPDWASALDVALAERAELRQSRLQIEEFQVRHEQRKSEEKPLLDLSLAGTGKGFSADASEAFDEAASYEFPTYSAMLTFSYPIGNRTASFAEKTAWANLRAANLAFDDLEAQVASEVRLALRQVKYQAEAVRAAVKSLDLARRQLEAEEKRHDEGISNYFQLLTAQQDLALAQATERQTRANYAKAIAATASAQGLIGEDLR